MKFSKAIEAMLAGKIVINERIYILGTAYRYNKVKNCFEYTRTVDETDALWGQIYNFCVNAILSKDWVVVDWVVVEDDPELI